MGEKATRRHKRNHRGHAAPARTPLHDVLGEYAGRWVALDRSTNEPRAVADTPDELVAEIHRQGLENIAVVRARDLSEPELVGLG